MGETIDILAGNFQKGFGQFDEGNSRSTACFILLKKNALGTALDSDIERIPLKEIDNIEIADEEDIMDIESSICWAAAGAGLLGPVGLLAGLMFGKSEKVVTFIARFRDGRYLLASTKTETYNKISLMVSDT